MKNTKYLLMLFIMILLTGCGAGDGKEKLDKALDNMSKVKSAKMETEMNVSIEGYSIIMNVEETFNEKGESYNKSTTKMLGQINYTETYVVNNDDKVVIYSGSNGDNWTYQEYDNEMNNTISTDGISSYASNYKSVKEVKSDIKGYTKLEVTIAKEDMMEKFKNGSEDAKFELADDLVMSVYIKDDYITKIMFNFEDKMQVAEDGTKTKYSFEFNISEHNNVGKINVPESVISKSEKVTE